MQRSPQHRQLTFTLSSGAQPQPQRLKRHNLPLQRSTHRSSLVSHRSACHQPRNTRLTCWERILTVCTLHRGTIASITGMPRHPTQPHLRWITSCWPQRHALWQHRARHRINAGRHQPTHHQKHQNHRQTQHRSSAPAFQNTCIGRTKVRSIPHARTLTVNTTKPAHSHQGVTKQSHSSSAVMISQWK